MKIGIIIYSHTGKTLSVAHKMQERLTAAGHSVEIEKITVVNDNEMDASKTQFKNIPDASKYDALIFGSPVRGFSLSAAMTAYLSQTAMLKGKNIFGYVTQFFPFPSMGGNRAIKQMKNLCEAKGVKSCKTGIVNYSNLRREKMIRDVVEKAGGLF